MKQPRIGLAIAAGLLIAMSATPAIAHDDVTELEGPNPAMWISDPDGVDGDSGTEQFDPVVGSAGSATVIGEHAVVKVRATGLVPGHVYTMWVVYFNDQTLCVDGCNFPDLPIAGAGSLYGDGHVAGASGALRFRADLTTGDNAEYLGVTPPPPFAFDTYAAGPNNEFHVVIKSHGPAVSQVLRDQLSTFGGGCVVGVGPAPEEVGDFPVPSAPGECGEIQLYVFK